MVHNSTTTEAVKGLNLSTTTTTKAEAVKGNAIKVASEAKAEANKARKESKKAEAEANKAKAKAEAGEVAKAEAKKAEAKAKKAREALEKAEALESKAIAEADKAKAEAKASKARERLAISTLTIKAEAVRKGLNSAVRALLESATEADCNPIELECLLAFVGRAIPTTEAKTREAVKAITKAEVITAYRENSAYSVTSGESYKVAKVVTAFKGANVVTFEESDSYNIGAIFRNPANNKRQGRKQFKAEAGKYYERVKGGFALISKAEAEARIKTAKLQAEAEASRKAEAEAQAEADRKAGEAIRLNKAKNPAK